MPDSSCRGESSGHGSLETGPRWFATTHWSVVLAAGSERSGNAEKALAQLCESYWYPLYAYVRRQGYSPPDAQDLTQEFFARFLERKYFLAANRERGKFRTFLLVSLKHFLAHEWEKAQRQKRGGGQTFVSLDEVDPEERYARELATELTPERLYDRRWALTVLEQTLAALREEHAASGRGELFERLAGFLSRPPAEGDYAALAAASGTTPGAIAVAVRRLRARYNALVREHIAQTVNSPALVDEELRYLITLVEK